MRRDRRHTKVAPLYQSGTYPGVISTTLLRESAPVGGSSRRRPVGADAIRLWREHARMRRTWVAGVVLAIAAVIVVVVSSALELELESAALLGAALGAVVALVPDRSPAARLGGFAAGFVAAWIGYLLRAALLPDSAGGRAVAVGLVVLLCVGITAASFDRLPLWSTLLGTAALSGAYEFTYAAAPPEFA